MNVEIFESINHLAGKWIWLDQIGIFFAQHFLYVFAIIVVGLWFTKPVRKNVYIALLSAGFSRILVVEVLKRILDRPRPFEIVENVQQLIVDEETGHSFPSGHTVIFFSFAFAFYGTKYFWPFLILAIIGSLARVFVGVHFPFDVLASIGIAAVVVWAARRLFKNRFLS